MTMSRVKDDRPRRARPRPAAVLVLSLAVLCAGPGAPLPAGSALPPAPGPVVQRPEAAPPRVRQIIVVGNSRTPCGVVLRQVPLHPDQVLTYPALRVAERNLCRLGLFEVRPEEGVRPRVCAVDDAHDPDNPFKDIVVIVEEVPLPPLAWEIADALDAGCLGQSCGLSALLGERGVAVEVVALFARLWRLAPTPAVLPPPPPAEPAALGPPPLPDSGPTAPARAERPG
jgi:hypothetical protein